jgi:2-Cys peroxiredoxin 5
LLCAVNQRAATTPMMLASRVYRIPLKHLQRQRQSFAASLRTINTSTQTMAPIKEGDAIPSVDLFEGAPDKKVNLAEACKDGKYIIFGVPGAFTPGCSKTHLPGYVSSAEALKAKGVKEIFCVSVNDPFVMGAWGENQVLGSIRCKRFSILVENGKASKVNVEPDGTGLTCSLAPNLL